jgi:hypothetical protein
MQIYEVMILVTGAALHRIQPLSIGSAPNLHRMPVAVISLTRKVSGRVTIHAARMMQYGDDVLESGSRVIARRRFTYLIGFGMFSLRNGIEYQQRSQQTAGRVS